jgi:UPF0271 protein
MTHATAHSIDLNADLGEGMGDDAAVMALVSSANIACGGHAGDAVSMRAALRAARDAGIAAGAHPGYEDRADFGRVVVPMDPGAIAAMVARQVGALADIAAGLGLRLAHVKAHGALYNLAAVDAGVARAVCDGIRAVDPGLACLCLSGSLAERVARDAGLRVVAEVFADRAVRPDGTLVPRGTPGAVIHDPAAVVARVRAMLADGAVTAVDGSRLPLAMDSICLHGDTPGAVALARALRAAILDAGWCIAAPGR